MPYASSHNAWRNSATQRNTWCCSHQSVLLPNHHGPYSCAQIRQTGRTLFLQTGQAGRESWVCKRRKAAPFCWEQPFFVTPTGFKPVTFWSVVRCSIQLSYGALFLVCGCKGMHIFCFRQTFSAIFLFFLQKTSEKAYFAYSSPFNMGKDMWYFTARSLIAHIIRNDNTTAMLTLSPAVTKPQ